MSRVHRIQSAATNSRVGFFLDVQDPFLSKAVAARDKDREFCMALLAHHCVALEQVLALVATMPLEAAHQRQLRATIRRWAKAAGIIEWVRSSSNAAAKRQPAAVLMEYCIK